MVLWVMTTRSLVYGQKCFGDTRFRHVRYMSQYFPPERSNNTPENMVAAIKNYLANLWLVCLASTDSGWPSSALSSTYRNIM